ncbi:MAG: DUF4230 domain-containing protein [Patescibacteria group bacterium]|nr:DUF4230 domain-containing protein [Patescibacteria group bacterium]
MINQLKRFADIVIGILAAAGVVFAGYFIYTTFFQQSGYYVNTSGTAVVKEIRKLQRLETASYTVEKIIDAGTQNSNRFQEFLFGDKILLIANGQIVAGFDFAAVQEGDIRVDGDIVTVNLPAPQVLYTRLDNSKTRVYDRRQGILTKGEKDLEAEARTEAEISLRQAACEAGILNTAEENGRKQITALLSALGFRNITVNIPKGECW